VIPVLILAGERKKKSLLLEKAGVPYKALLPVCGEPMFKRVMAALEGVSGLGKIYVSAPEDLFERLKKLSSKELLFLPQASSPSLSVFQALEIIDTYPLFITTADHALLTPEIVAYFIHRAAKEEGDLGVGVVSFSLVKAAYPEASRTTYRLREGRFCSANLYFISHPEAQKIFYFWRRIERHRKNPLKVVLSFGITPFWRYLAGRLTLREAFEEISRRIGCRLFPVLLPFARAAIDVDDEEDLHLAQQILHKEKR